MLLQYQELNINAQDNESGYTALHKCLLDGQLRLALLILSKRSVDFTIEDNEKLTCIEMLEVCLNRNLNDLSRI